MLHPQLVGEMLDGEIEVARERLAGRFLAIDRAGTAVVCTPPVAAGPWRVALDGRGYDAEPFHLSIVDGNGSPLPGGSWPSGLYAGGEHPVLKVPWACVQGTFEYHLLPGHHSDPWDAHRNVLRLDHLLGHILRRCGL